MHQGYVDTLNKAISDTEFEGKSLEEIVRTAEGGRFKSGRFNNAAQIWTHTFYWNSLSPEGGGPAKGDVSTVIDSSFGSFDEFKAQVTKFAGENFGSGWTRLVKKKNGSLAILNTSNARTPLTDSEHTPLLTVDVW